MSLHPTARALLEAIAEKARAQTTPTRYVSMWTALDQEADGCDVAFTAWESAGFPLDAPETEPWPNLTACPVRDEPGGWACLREEGHPGGHHYIAGATTTPSVPYEPTELQQAEAWARGMGFRKAPSGYWFLNGTAISYDDDAALIAAYKARPREEARPPAAAARCNPDAWPTASGHDIALAGLVNQHADLLNAIHDRLAALEKT